MTRSARGQRSSKNSVRTRLPSAASTRHSASDCGRVPRHRRRCRTIAALHSENAAGIRVHGSVRRRLVYGHPLFVEIHSDWRRRTVEKPARYWLRKLRGGCNGYGNDICAATGSRTQRPVAQGSHRIDGRHRDRVVRLFPLGHRGRSHLRQALLPQRGTACGDARPK